MNSPYARCSRKSSTDICSWTLLSGVQGRSLAQNAGTVPFGARSSTLLEYGKPYHPACSTGSQLFFLVQSTLVSSLYPPPTDDAGLGSASTSTQPAAFWTAILVRQTSGSLHHGLYQVARTLSCCCCFFCRIFF